MILYERIEKLIVLPGVTGMEDAVAAEVSAQFAAAGAEVIRDRAGNVYGKLGGGRPAVLLMAHMDEIGMMVSRIEDNGMLRICKVAGVDPRILPGGRVLVYGENGAYPGVVSTAPLRPQTDDKVAWKMEDLIVDTGLSPKEAQEKLAVGDMVTLYPQKPVQLGDGMMTGKTLDDRALVAALAQLLCRLNGEKLPCTLIACASVQEEKSGAGAMAGGWNIRPDMAVAVDVTHAPPPEKEFRTVPIDKLAITRGGNIHPFLYEQMKAAAERQAIPYTTEARIGDTGTDAWDIQTQRGGIPTGLLSVPLRYMHTGAEVLSGETLGRAVDLLEEFIRDIPKDWEEALCFKE